MFVRGTFYLRHFDVKRTNAFLISGGNSFADALRPFICASQQRIHAISSAVTIDSVFSKSRCWIYVCRAWTA